MTRTFAAACAAAALLLAACGAAPAEPRAEAAATASPATPAATPASAPAATAPAVEKRTVTKKRSIPYKTTKVNDPSLAKGTTRVKRRGVKGVMTYTYEVTYTGGEPTGKKLLGKKVTRKPVTRVVAVGTKSEPRCDENYSGACVPIASDVDCAGGSGNGPAYVSGPVRVVGTDIYDLDRDGDGTACDS
ncbi:G5 domain-containing protein [Actinomadura rifamycini]|uniref:G5 domain-containing protein n=1 Tax=Actinomadura rifamycini TaxID=31962 RepID=UPI0004259A7D|nr:G5 domain-containing protein [Actinomadura rifamycini]